MDSNINLISKRVLHLKSISKNLFSDKIILGIESAISDTDNPLRYNFFSTAMRMLLENTMDNIAPKSSVSDSPWYKVIHRNHNGDPDVTRRQRIEYAIHGGIRPTFIKDELNINVESISSSLNKSHTEFSKHIHSRENNIILDNKEQNKLILLDLENFIDFLNTYHECRDKIIEPIIEKLDTEAIDAFLSQTIIEIDEISSHHSVEEICNEDIYVHEIDANYIFYHVEGTVTATLQFGSNSDLRKGDGAELEESFNFTCTIELPVEDPWHIPYATTYFRVDTDKWYE